MTQSKLNKVNPCARILADLAHTCFMIGEETKFTAQFEWAGHVSSLRICVYPDGGSFLKSVLELHEYINIPEPGAWRHSAELGEDTYPELKRFALQLKKFHRNNLAE